MARLAQLESPDFRGGVGAKARLALVEALLAEQEARPCALFVLRWLVRHAGIERGFCAVIDAERLVGLTGIDIPMAALDAFSLGLDDRTHPLVIALAGSEPVAFPNSGHSSGQELLRPFETPLGTDSFHAVPLSRTAEHGDFGPGLLLLSAQGDGPLSEDVRWAAEILGVRLVSLWYRRAQLDERRHKRERSWLFGVINAVTDPILLTDLDGRILMANAVAEMLLTADDQKSEGRRRAVALNNLLFSAALFNKDGLEPSRRELLLVDPTDGQDLLFEVISTPVRIRLGEAGVALILRNVTDLRRASEEIEENYRKLRAAEVEARADAMEKVQLYEQVTRHSEELREKVRLATAELAGQNELLRRQAFELEQASAAKSQFLANVSHELRTPLNAIIGYTHLMLEGVAGEMNASQHEKLNRVDSNARHLLAIINDLLDIARIESGKLPVQLERVALPDLVDEVMTEVEPLIDGTSLTVSRVIAPAVPELRTDRQKVKQIILNLLSNALKFTPQGSVSIVLDYDPGEEEASVAVTDTGIGISEENQKTIFEAFGQADSSYAKRHGGTGLGLSICCRLAAILGGRITVVSKLGEGSTFTLALPRRARK
jgi:signal transduction histidine kinase